MPNGMVSDDINYIVIEGFPTAQQLEEMLVLYQVLFKDADLPFFKTRLKNHSACVSVLAYKDGQLIGFKIGYPYSHTTFYSWVGGVLTPFRNQGIATQMAKLQEDHVRLQGFQKLRTKSMNQFKPMMALNLKNGFDIVQVYTNTKGQTKIVFEKSI